MESCDFNNYGLISGFLSSLSRYPDHPALEVNHQVYSYSQLANKSFGLSKCLVDSESGSSYVGILAYRSITAYAGILASLSTGKTYIPLNPFFPIDRLCNQIDQADCDLLIVGDECLDLLEHLLENVSRSLTIVCANKKFDNLNSSISTNINHTYVYPEYESVQSYNFKTLSINIDSAAYLLFTSGSTGVPKGVEVTHRNVKSFINNICKKYAFDENDRFSQTADINFDLSVLEIFPCWESGACLCCLPKQIVMAPAKFIRENNLTVWVSVPSVGIFMSKMRLLKPDSFPDLKYCMFCGEALLQEIAQKWQIAAPNSTIVNLYGPTEAAVAITDYIWNKDSPEKCINGIVPIGTVFSDQMTCIVDNDLKVVNTGETGELCLSGSQVTKGYYKNEEKTKSQYVHIKDYDNRLWYRTGDLVFEDDEGVMHYLTRADNQVQVLGYRVELQEIDNLLMKLTATELAVTIAWPVINGNAQGLVAFVSNVKISDERGLLKQCAEVLPAYMIPNEIISINKIPVNSNGKIDRTALTNIIRGRVIS